MGTKTIVNLDSAKISAFLECETKSQFLYEENLRYSFPKREDDEEGNALDKGTAVHELLHLYYVRRALNPNPNHLLDANDSWDEFISLKKLEELNLDPNKFGVLLRRRWSEYAIKYYPSVDIYPKVINGKVGSEIGFTKKIYEDKHRIYILEGRIDLLSTIKAYDAQYDIFWDHKSQGKEQNLYDYTPQFLTYALATGYRYGGINYFGLQEKNEGQCFRRQLIFFPEWKIEEWYNKVLSIFHRIYNHKRYGVPYEKNHSSCSGGYYPCVFSKICDSEPSKRASIKAFHYVEVEPWSPWQIAKTTL